MIITIDGPAGSGKSTAAKMLAGRLGFEFLDTGAMYRAVAFAGLRAGIDIYHREALAGILPSLHIDLLRGRVLLTGADVTEPIRPLKSRPPPGRLRRTRWCARTSWTCSAPWPRPATWSARAATRAP